ncbi:hypothetical protein [Tropicimonas sp. IMCC6043]|uniref:hypothetical protein n=1 Tax=Tropicimonas sp. IMCC6043 TaxID=2510645 RepID=UPI00101E0C9A|nr:hypothetical protein [Tropicimonas sp. IMCC6043]RYH07799.1 hypothetical protein EU800_18950 [Tropicimonas sp. IMCC6043]
MTSLEALSVARQKAKISSGNLSTRRLLPPLSAPGTSAMMACVTQRSLILWHRPEAKFVPRLRVADLDLAQIAVLGGGDELMRFLLSEAVLLDEGPHGLGALGSVFLTRCQVLTVTARGDAK